jgi:large subunit ribosomal protein L4
MPIALDVHGVDGAVTGSVDLDDGYFGIQPNVPVMHQVVTAQLAAARAGTQSTKTRAEVSGGGKKPFKQKGTGRARQGSERAPHFSGGGVALGPKPRSYRQKTPRKMVQLALRSALSDRAAEGRVAVVERWPWDEPSTRQAKAALKALELTGRVLLVLGRDDSDAYKSFRNLPRVQVILQSELNAYDILCNDWIVFTVETLPGSGAQTGSGSQLESATPTATVADESSSDESASAGSSVEEDPTEEDPTAAEDDPTAAEDDDTAGDDDETAAGGEES